MKNTSIILLAAGLFRLTAFSVPHAMTHDCYGGKTDCWQLTRHAEKLAEARQNPPDVVFVGDSITHNWESKFGDHWQRHLAGAPYRALNLGFSGDRTEHVLWRLVEGGELDGYRARAVVLMIGTNNAAHYEFAEEPPVDTILGIREILRVIRERQPQAKIVLLPIFPRGPNARDSDARNRIVNREIAKFADGANVFWCDFNAQLMTADGRLPRGVFPDQLHPAEYGYDVWFAAVKPYLDYALSDGALPTPANRYAPYLQPGEVRMDEPATVFPTARFRSADDALLDGILEHRSRIAATTGTVDVVLFGDSQPCADKCGGLSALTVGDREDCTENLIWLAQNGELDGYRAGNIIVTAGGANHRDSAEDVALGIRKLLDIIAKKQPEAKILLRPIPLHGKKKDKLRAKNKRTNELIRDYADGKRVIWCDGDQLPLNLP